MTTPTAQTPRPGLSEHFSRRLAPQLRRLKEFTLSPEARPALVGALGAALITAGGLGAGSTRLHDPLLESMHLSWLRFGHGLVLSSVLLWAGVGADADGLAVARAAAASVRTRTVPPSTPWSRPPDSG